MYSAQGLHTVVYNPSFSKLRQTAMSTNLHFHFTVLRLQMPTSNLLSNFPPSSSISTKTQLPKFITRAKTNINPKPFEKPQPVEAEIVSQGEKNLQEERGEEEFSHSSSYRGREDEKDFDRDPEFAEILGSCFDDPQKAQSKVEERIRRKRSKILHTKTGSATPIKVIFNKFDFSNSYIWFEFYNVPLPKDVTLICDTIRSWYIIGRLGGCNSMNMQLSQTPLDTRRPKYDAIQGANVTPTTFYNIGDLELQDNLARIWVDIGTSEPLLLDVLVNALTCISSDYVGIKRLVFGDSEFENWKENLTSEDAGYSSHTI